MRSVGYRLLGSFADADDVVQEAWLRYRGADVDDATLTAMVADLLGADPSSVVVQRCEVEEFPYDLPAITTAGRYVVTGEGNGPVNALDQALRSAIGQAFPSVGAFQLIDYKVRILDQGHGTDAITRVLIETSDGQSSWVTVGVGANVIQASWGALVDGLTFGLRRQGL